MQRLLKLSRPFPQRQVSSLPAHPVAPVNQAPSRRQDGYKKYSLLPLLMFCLTACSGATVIDQFTAEYRGTQASSSDAQILVNILRAKDNVPIHFTDLSVIHGSMQFTAGAGASIPLSQNGSAAPDILTPAIAVQNSPTFDIGTMDTQDFTKGILSPINIEIVKQLFDQGIDPRVMFLLFFSEYQDLHNRHYMNNMACDLSRPMKQGRCFNHVYDYLHAIDALFERKGLKGKEKQQLQANVYMALKPVGGYLSGDWSFKEDLGELRQLDLTKYRLKGKQLYSVSEPRLAICYERDHALYPLFDELSSSSREACNKNEVIVSGDTPGRNIALPIRSAYEIMMYLGQVLRFQEERGGDRCLTLAEENRDCDDGEVLFQVNAPVGNPVIATQYQGSLYTVNDRHCNKNSEQACDYSPQVLAILELLLNANKAAKDIVAIPRVQVVP